MSLEERRRADRVAFKMSVALEIGNSRIESQSTEDLSVQGIFVHCRENHAQGTPCRVILRLSGRSSRLTLEIDGRIARVVPGKGMAIEFVCVDLDCYTHLKYIVEHNRNPEVFAQKETEKVGSSD